jgi:hypothetical protein
MGFRGDGRHIVEGRRRPQQPISCELEASDCRPLDHPFPIVLHGEEVIANRAPLAMLGPAMGSAKPPMPPSVIPQVWHAQAGVAEPGSGVRGAEGKMGG